MDDQKELGLQWKVRRIVLEVTGMIRKCFRRTDKESERLGVYQKDQENSGMEQEILGNYLEGRGKGWGRINVDRKNQESNKKGSESRKDQKK
jgi:hypothetical protein